MLQFILVVVDGCNPNSFISIHLMLQFIVKGVVGRMLFCGISIHLMLQFIKLPHPKITGEFSYFNTSHVVVYPWQSCAYVARYINFNTSHVVVYLESKQSLPIAGLRFQYISCCSLSCCAKYSCSSDFGISIHLMLQFIKIYELTKDEFQDFNTSHVVVYQLWKSLLSTDKLISIHLMLQFI